MTRLKKHFFNAVMDAYTLDFNAI